MDIIKAVEADYLKEQTAPLLIGDYVKVHFKVKMCIRDSHTTEEEEQQMFGFADEILAALRYTRDAGSV